jgi:predicted  nucleic acid-binding Zn-ribbon protein
MKKSFLSFLLGVAVIASTSVFVSCQDYQDEFKDLQDQINKEHPALNDKVTALETEIDNLQTALDALKAQHKKDVDALAEADRALQQLLSDEIVKAKAYALAQAEKALADAKAYADAKAAEEAEQALKAAQAYADKVAAAEAQRAAQAALLAANEQAQALFNDAIAQLNKAVETINAQIATEKSERQAADAALEKGYKDADAALEKGYKAGDAALEKGYKDADAAIDAAYKAADAAIWTALNKAQNDIEAAQAAADKAQTTANEALTLAKANEKAIADEVVRAKKAEADLKADLDEEAARAKAEEAKIWEAIQQANANIAANAARIEEVYDALSKKIDAAVDRIRTLENKVATLQAEMKAAQDKLNDHETRILALEAWTATYEPIIKDLQTRMATAETKIGDLYTKLAAEEAARIEADAELQRQITANAEKIAQEILDRIAADKVLQNQIDQNKTAIAKNAADIKDLQDECKKIWKALADEEAARKKADADEKAAREAADAAEKAAREAADAELHRQIDAINVKIEDLQKQINDLDAKVERYYKELGDRLTEVENQIQGIAGNPFEVITEIDFQAAFGPIHHYSYYPAFDIVDFGGGDFSEPNRIVADSYTFEPGKLFVLLAPMENDFVGHPIYVRNEWNEPYPGYEFGTAEKAVYDEDTYFNWSPTPVTRADKTNEGPIWMADINAEQPADAVLLANIPPVAPPHPPVEGYYPKYAVVGEYIQKNAALEDVKQLIWDEEFDFTMTPDSFHAVTAAVLEGLDFDASADKYDVTLDFTDPADPLIYKQKVVCDSVYDECDEPDLDALAYMNGLNDLFDEWVESGELADFTVTVDEEYANHTFFFSWYVVGKSGETEHLTDQVTIVPEFDPTIEATFNFEVTPESADFQVSDVLTTSAEGYDITTLGWCKYVPDCQNVTVTLAPVKPAPENSLVFNLKNVKDYLALDVPQSATCTKAEVDSVESLGITYDPAKLVVDETYTYTVTVEYGDKVISISTINVLMRRPTGHDIELEKITSAWNKDKTRTIVWARGYDEQNPYSDAWYLLKGSFTNIMDYIDPVDPCGCTLVFKDVTEYSAEEKPIYEMEEVPSSANQFKVVVPAEAVQANAKTPLLSYGQVFDGNGWFYDLEYGTNVFGLENLYGGESLFQIAYASPIYYDGAKYDWDTKDYDPDGKCVLVNDEGEVDANGFAVFYIDFPKMEYTISEANFVGSNDPSTSIVDPIKYFGEKAPDYATWEANRDAFYVTKTAPELLYQDARIQKIEIKLGDATDIQDLYPSYYVWNDPTNEYLFAQLPVIGEDGIFFKTYDEYPSLTSTPAFYYNFTVTDIWGCVKNYPFIITISPNVPVQPGD